MSGATTATVSAHSHLDGRVRDEPGDSSHPTMPGTGAIRGGRLRIIKTKGMYNQVHLVKIGLKKKKKKKKR